MATKLNNTTAFIAKCLAPLPAEEAQPSDKAFLRTLKADMQARWTSGMQRVHIAQHERNAMNLRRMIAQKEGIVFDDCQYQRRYFEEVGRQMMIPAPGKAALNWKIGARKLDGGRDYWEESIALDHAWLATLAAAGIR